MDEMFSIHSNEYKKKLFERLCGISAKFKITYPINHKLCYDYPKIDPIICQNIVNCLVKYPNFYEQTLHLMNKMNLPCPLYPYIRESSCMQMQEDKKLDKSSSESEIESDSETNLKRKLSTDTCDQFKKIKIKSILKSMNLATQKQQNFNLTEVFEKTDKNVAQNNLKLKQKKLDYDRIKIDFQSKIPAKVTDVINEITTTAFSSTIESQKEFEEKECELFIKKKDLESNYIKLNELEKLPIFKNYDKGTKNSRIYLKNLSKKVTEDDLKFIYGRYIDWSYENQKKAFNIRLMKEGRMKGQAFINFPNEDIAEKAINETLGYVLDGKPIIAQFSRIISPS